MDKVDIVQLSLKYSAGVLLLKEIPSIRASTAEKMGVKGIPGINIEMPVEGDRKETKQARKTDDVNNDNHDDRDDINNHDNTTNNT